MHDEHRQAHHPGEQGKGVEQAEEAAAVIRAQHVVEGEGHPLQEVSEGHPEHQGRNGAADEQAPVPGIAPARVGHLAAVLEAHRPEEQGEEHKQKRPVKAREGGRVHQGPGGEERSAAGDEPHLVAFPGGADAVDQHAAFVVRFGHERQQRSHSEVEAVHDGKPDEQRSHQQPPDDLEREVVEQDRHRMFPPYTAALDCSKA